MTAWRSWFTPSIVWVSGLSSGDEVKVFTHWDILLAPGIFKESNFKWHCHSNIICCVLCFSCDWGVKGLWVIPCVLLLVVQKLKIKSSLKYIKLFPLCQHDSLWYSDEEDSSSWPSITVSHPATPPHTAHIFSLVLILSTHNRPLVPTVRLASIYWCISSHNKIQPPQLRTSLVLYLPLISQALGPSFLLAPPSRHPTFSFW